MVLLKSLRCSGLYSYSEETSIEFSNNTIIVGPNNSGKSNLLRALKLFSDSFSMRKRLQDQEISHNGANPSIEIRLKLTGDEPDKIIDFLSFYPEGNNRGSQFYQFKNREFLKKQIDDIHVTLSWQRTVGGHGTEAYVIIEFEKIGLKLFNYIYSGYRISTKIPPEGEPTSGIGDKKIQDILDELSETENVKDEITKIFELEKNICFDLSYLFHDQNTRMSDKARQTFRELYSYVGYPLESNRQISFTELFGTILKKGILYSSGSRGTFSRTLLDCAKELRYNSAAYYNQQPDPKSQFDEMVVARAMSKSLEFVDELKDDGSNLPQFLLSLKNSPRYTDIEKFDSIRHAFEEIFHLENLSMDILLEYEDDKRYTQGTTDRKPKFSKIVIVDQKIGKHFPIDQVGSGIKEVIYLLTTAYGVKNSVVMLDEPAVNLHPPMMRAIMRHLENSKNENQFIIITHSPELLRYELFEASGQVHYVKKLNHVSHLKSLSGDSKNAFEENRRKFKHQIDMRIFFGKCIILTEGESDKNLLTGIAQFFEDTDNTLNLNTQDIIIVSVGGKPNFPKYRQYLDAYEINHIIMADNDAKEDTFSKEKYGIISKNDIKGNGPIFLIENGDLEKLMMEIDEKIYNNIKSVIGDSKPIVALEFAERITMKNPSALDSIKKFLLCAVEMAKS